MEVVPRQQGISIERKPPRFGAASTLPQIVGSGRHSQGCARPDVQPVVIYDRAQMLYSNTISTYGQVDSFNFTVSFADPDEVMTFMVESVPGSPTSDLSTGLQATVDPG